MTEPAANPQHVLVTLLGTYFFGQQQPIPSSFVVELLGELDVTPVGARNALSRVTRRGLLEVSRAGRNTYYQLSAQAHQNHAARLAEILTHGAGTRHWNGTWTIALFSVPEDQRRCATSCAVGCTGSVSACCTTASGYAPGPPTSS
jgi:phenylacetic acid degradation operon negative regulatory protein